MPAQANAPAPGQPAGADMQVDKPHPSTATVVERGDSAEWEREMQRIRNTFPGFSPSHEAALSRILVPEQAATAPARIFPRRTYCVSHNGVQHSVVGIKALRAWCEQHLEQQQQQQQQQQRPGQGRQPGPATAQRSSGNAGAPRPSLNGNTATVVCRGQPGWAGLMDSIRCRWPGFAPSQEARLLSIRVVRRKPSAATRYKATTYKRFTLSDGTVCRSVPELKVRLQAQLHGKRSIAAAAAAAALPKKAALLPKHGSNAAVAKVAAQAANPPAKRLKSAAHPTAAAAAAAVGAAAGAAGGRQAGSSTDTASPVIVPSVAVLKDPAAAVDDMEADHYASPAQPMPLGLGGRSAPSHKAAAAAAAAGGGSAAAAAGGGSAAPTAAAAAGGGVAAVLVQKEVQRLQQELQDVKRQLAHMSQERDAAVSLAAHLHTQLHKGAHIFGLLELIEGS